MCILAKGDVREGVGDFGIRFQEITRFRFWLMSIGCKFVK